MSLHPLFKNKHVLSAYSVPDTVLDTGDAKVNKTAFLSWGSSQLMWADESMNE